MARLGRSLILRSIILAPYLIANVITAIIWYWMLDPLLGFGNAVLQWIGIGRIPFFTDQHLALPTIAAVNIWRHTGLTALLFYTGIQAIPKDIYESRQNRGSRALEKFFRNHLTTNSANHGLRPGDQHHRFFSVFDTIAVTTLGGPNYSTRTIVWYIYENGFVNFRMGYASALSCALFVCLAIVTLVQMRILRSGQSDLG